jgi:hypothetical protein
MVTILDFLLKLDENLNMSINTFQNTPKHGVQDINKLHELIQSNNKKLYKYLECLKQLEYLYFTNKDFGIDDNQFIFAFNIDNELYNKNFKQIFKDDMNAKINIFKLKKHIDTIKKVNSFTESRDIKQIDSIDITPNNLNIPVIKNLNDIPSMFYWYDGGNVPQKKGIYTCIAPGFCVRVPFPNTISTTASNPNFKIYSTPCKYETKEACLKNKKNISLIYKSEIRECYYTHKKEKFSKIGSFYKCKIDNFGNHENLNSDLNHININDIKRILMYALSDSLFSTIWYQNQFKDGNLLLNNIEYY